VHGKDLVKIPKLKEEQRILATFSAAAIRSMVSCRATTQGERRLHALVCLLLDTGLRISEALSLTKENVDLDNLAIKVYGKDGKHHLVPFSLELRKVLLPHPLMKSPFMSMCLFAPSFFDATTNSP
jgi:integrase/recombinase XerD